MFARGGSPGRAEPGAAISPNNVAFILLSLIFRYHLLSYCVLLVSVNARFSLKVGESFVQNKAVC